MSNTFDHGVACLQNDGHESRPWNPSEPHGKLSEELEPVPQGEYGGRGRAASAMSMFFAASAIDKDLQKKVRPLLIVGQLFFKKALDANTLKDVLRQRLLSIPRFRCVIKETADKAMNLQALPSELIDMDYHVKVMSKPDEKPWTREMVDMFVSKVYRGDTGDEDSMDYTRPPWRFYVVNMQDGRTLMINVIDHMVVDGVAAVATLMAILDDEPKEKLQSHAPPTKRLQGPPMSFTGKIHAFLVGLKEAFLAPALPADPQTTLKERDHRNPGLEKSCAMGEKVSLEEMKRIKSKIPGATVNDIMLATLTLTLQSYFREVGQELKPIRGNFPINMRPAQEDVMNKSMGNRFAPGNFVFPMTATDPVKMIWKIKEQIDTIKNSPAPWITNKVFGMLIPKMIMGGKRVNLQEMLLDAYGKVTVMLSNVPGPSGQVSFCGQPVDDLMFYALSPIGCYLGMLSYNGKVSVGVTTSTGVESEASRVAKHWAPAFEKLRDAVDAAPVSAFKPPRSWGDGALSLFLLVITAALVHWKFFASK